MTIDEALSKLPEGKVKIKESKISFPRRFVPLQSGREDLEKVFTKAVFNPADYIQIPGTNGIIRAYQSINGFIYSGALSVANTDGLLVSSPSKFITHLINVVSSYKKKTILYDGNGNEIPPEKTERIYQYLTREGLGKNHEKGIGTWLCARFFEGSGYLDLDIETDFRAVNGGVTATISQLEECVSENCFVDLDPENFNSQGLPKRRSKTQKYIQGENIYFTYPRKDRVSRFYAYSDMADLDCGGGSGNSFVGLGVLTYTEGVPKNCE